MLNLFIDAFFNNSQSKIVFDPCMFLKDNGMRHKYVINSC
jgi:hypothetical protein